MHRAVRERQCVRSTLKVLKLMQTHILSNLFSRIEPPPVGDPNCHKWQMNYDKHVQKSINKISKIYTKYTQID